MRLLRKKLRDFSMVEREAWQDFLGAHEVTHAFVRSKTHWFDYCTQLLW